MLDPLGFAKFSDGFRPTPIKGPFPGFPSKGFHRSPVGVSCAQKTDRWWVWSLRWCLCAQKCFRIGAQPLGFVTIFSPLRENSVSSWALHLCRLYFFFSGMKFTTFLIFYSIPILFSGMNFPNEYALIIINWYMKFIPIEFVLDIRSNGFNFCIFHLQEWVPARNTQPKIGVLKNIWWENHPKCPELYTP